ncbi:MAG: hypothetical protein KKC51_08410 [Verrucomicrobia bacterium]|nr:hypothetical protein [Verrucomicrobiota bacterium]
MLDAEPSIYSLIVLVLLSVAQAVSLVSKGRLATPASLPVLWGLFLALAVSEWISFIAALWILAIISFCALREYLSLVDIRLEDRWGILFSYFSIPFMFYLIQIDWYGFFIVAIPVYAFLLMPVCVALGGRSRGIVFSVGALDFGLFFYVSCMGHLCYLAFFSERIAMLMIATVAAADLIHRALRNRPRALRVPLQVVVACVLFTGLAEWSAIPLNHSFALGIIIPLLVCLGRFTLKQIEDDLGIRADRLQPGRGRTIDALKSYLFIAPIVFHYLRWFLKWGAL